VYNICYATFKFLFSLFNFNLLESYIRLKDVTCQFQKPSVMDVKVGPITYDCEADEAKRIRESKKFPALGKIGFQIVGIKVS